jgi:DNA-binding NarL/FixJ family response regulator
MEGSKMPKIKVLLIEDNRLLREGIKALLNNEPDIRAESTAATNGDVFIKAEKIKPHVVLLDLGLKTLNSLEVVEQFNKKLPESKIVVMDLIPVYSDIVDFVKVGVAGFILKDATLPDFLHTIRTVHKGIKVLPPTMITSLFSQIVEYAVKEDKTDLLIKSVQMTRREQEIIAQIAKGRSNKEISDALNIAVHTVKSHVHHILEKLALHTRLELASFAHEQKTPEQI